MSRKDKSPRDNSRADLSDLQQRIDARRDRYRPKANEPRTPWSLGMRYGSEFFAGVLAGGGLGMLLDFVAKTGPWGLVAGILLGFAAGTLNVVRAAREINSETNGD